EDRKLVAQGVLGEAHDLLDRAGPPRARFDRGIVRHHAHGTTVDPPDAGHDAIGREVFRHGVGQESVLDPRPLVEEQGQAVSYEQLVLAGELLALAVEVSLQGPVAGAGDVHSRGAPTSAGWREWRRRPAADRWRTRAPTAAATCTAPESRCRGPGARRRRCAPRRTTARPSAPRRAHRCTGVRGHPRRALSPG